MDQSVFFVLVVVLGIVVAGAAFWLSQQRHQAMQELADRHGWQLTRRDDRWGRQFTGRPFDRSRRNHTRNILSGRFRDRPFTAFDYTYVTTSGSGENRSEQHHHFSVVGLGTGLRFPALEVMPAGFFNRIGAKVTGRDISFESEEFNRAFTITCPDRKFASDVIHPRLMEKLMRHRDLDFRFEGTWLIAIHHGRQHPEDVIGRAEAVAMVLDEIPEFVWRERQGGAIG
ncbi:DUF3137 domain-containing protein [Nocardioides limicola]|uniref:DUF3137 domain-containing protein n=1 Tax=Nocardioides limicola TaxID=2803368 RepID=UPI00193B1A8C|nr:DUF3137 domain-containing protein [Nocardioides sp. DJM-14]